MKTLLFLILISINIPAIATCRFGVIQQEDSYLIVQRISGDLPNKDAIIEAKLTRGVNNVKFKTREHDDDEGIAEIKESRLKVRFSTKDKEYAKQILKRYCP